MTASPLNIELPTIHTDSPSVPEVTVAEALFVGSARMRSLLTGGATLGEANGIVVVLTVEFSDSDGEMLMDSDGISFGESL